MVVALTNDRVYVYDIDEFLYINIISGLDFKSTDLDEYKIYDIAKSKYTPLRMSQDLGDQLARINYYYYDNGREMVKKTVNDVFDIKYYEDSAGELWPSKEYYQYVNSNVSTNMKYAEIIALDHELNACKHIQSLLSLTAIEDFKRYYDNTQQYSELSNEAAALAISKYYDVTSYGKLIIIKDKGKLTSAKLEGNVFVSVSPAGIDENGVTRYFYSEFLITKQDTADINIIFRRLLKEEGLKADSMTEQEKYLYYNHAVLEHTKNIRGELESASNKIPQFINNHTYTEEELKNNFKLKHGRELPDLSSMGIEWLKHITTRLDARNVRNGYIVPLIIEEYQREKNIVEAQEEALSDMEASMEKKVMNVSDLLAIEELVPESEEEITIPGDTSDEDEINISGDDSDEDEIDIPGDTSDEEEIDIPDDNSLDDSKPIQGEELSAFLLKPTQVLQGVPVGKTGFRFVDPDSLDNLDDIGDDVYITENGNVLGTSWQGTLDGDIFIPTDKKRYIFKDGELVIPEEDIKGKKR